jgi:hypothetical protein
MPGIEGCLFDKWVGPFCTEYYWVYFRKVAEFIISLIFLIIYLTQLSVHLRKEW